MSDPATSTVDIIVIGGGPVGENAAQYAIEGTTMTAAIIEAELLGGECSYWACIPSKTLLRPIDVARTTSLLDGVETASVQRTELLARRDEWVSNYDDSGQVQWAEGAGLEVVRGRGRIAGELTVEVDGDSPRRITARKAVIIATGSTPAIPSLLAPLHPWTSRDATGVVEVPDRLLIIGGGVVACEAATWMRALGSEVTLAVRGDALLPGNEPFAGEAVAEGLEGAGVKILYGFDAADAERDDREGTDPSATGRRHGGEVRVRAADGREVTADELLVATGRTPALSNIGLESIGLTPKDVLAAAGDAGGLPEWLHAVGDASGEAKLTHWGNYRARVLGARIAGQPSREVAQVPVPSVVFSDPQVASVGMTEAAARESGAQIVVSEVPFAAVAGTTLMRDEAPGSAKIVVDGERGVLLGATFVGPEAADLVHAATVAIVGQVPVAVLRHAVPSFPTPSELWLRLLEALPRELRG